jgi:hypothetical protein
VTADVDELLVFPGSEETSLRALTAYLDEHGYDAFSCLLLDFYPNGPLHESPYQPGDDFLEAAPYFDAGPYKRTPLRTLCPDVLIRGGMRERVFYSDFRTRSLAEKIYDLMLHQAALRIPVVRNIPWLRAQRRPAPPCLTKVPLIRWDQKSKYLHSTHFISRKVVAPETGALLHFKFLHDFHDRAVEEAARGEHYDGASEYRRYAERLSKNPDMTLAYEGSTRFEGTSQLVRLGLIQETEAWAAARFRGTP